MDTSSSSRHGIYHGCFAFSSWCRRRCGIGTGRSGEGNNGGINRRQHTQVQVRVLPSLMRGTGAGRVLSKRC